MIEIDYELKDCIIILHYVARTVADKIGDGSLSEEIRESADKLNYLISYDVLSGANNGTN